METTLPDRRPPRGTRREWVAFAPGFAAILALPRLPLPDAATLLGAAMAIACLSLARAGVNGERRRQQLARGVVLGLLGFAVGLTVLTQCSAEPGTSLFDVATGHSTSIAVPHAVASIGLLLAWLWNVRAQWRRSSHVGSDSTPERPPRQP